jgi:hypothetical protein
MQAGLFSFGSANLVAFKLGSANGPNSQWLFGIHRALMTRNIPSGFKPDGVSKDSP